MVVLVEIADGNGQDGYSEADDEEPEPVRLPRIEAKRKKSSIERKSEKLVIEYTQKIDKADQRITALREELLILGEQTGRLEKVVAEQQQRFEHVLKQQKRLKVAARHRIACAVNIQRVFRGFQTRSRLMAQAIREKGTAVRALQKNLVGLQAMLHSIVFRESHRQHAANLIQKWWKRTLTSRVAWLADVYDLSTVVYAFMLRCVVTLQAVFRGFKIRKFVCKFREDLLEEEEREIRHQEHVLTAAVMVQRHVRGLQGRKRMKELRKGIQGRLMEASQPGTWLAGAAQTSALPGPDVLAAVEIQRAKVGTRSEKEERVADADQAQSGRPGKPGKHSHGRTGTTGGREEGEASRRTRAPKHRDAPKRPALDEQPTAELYARSKELTVAQKKKRGVKMKKDGKLVDGDVMKAVQANAQGLFDMGAVIAFEQLQRNLLFNPLVLDTPVAAPVSANAKYADIAAGIFPVHLKS